MLQVRCFFPSGPWVLAIGEISLRSSGAVPHTFQQFSAHWSSSLLLQTASRLFSCSLMFCFISFMSVCISCRKVLNSLPNSEKLLTILVESSSKLCEFLLVWFLPWLMLPFRSLRFFSISFPSLYCFHSLNCLIFLVFFTCPKKKLA